MGIICRYFFPFFFPCAPPISVVRNSRHLAFTFFLSLTTNMKLQALTALFLLNAANAHNIKHRNLQVVHKRQATTSSGTTSVGPSSTGPSSGTGTATAGHPTSTPPAGHPISIPSPAVSGVPPLESITFGMPSQATLPVTATYAAGATPPVSGAPALPTTCM